MRRKILLILATLGLTFSMTGVAQAANTPMYGTWPVQGGTRIVYVADHSDYLWPVNTGISTWNSYLAVNHVPIRFSYTNTCSGHEFCFDVYSTTACYHNQANVWGGETFVQPMLFGGMDIVKIVFYECGSLALNAGYNERQHVTNHEEGHALGLNHHPCVLPADLMQASCSIRPLYSVPSVDNMRALISKYPRF